MSIRTRITGAFNSLFGKEGRAQTLEDIINSVDVFGNSTLSGISMTTDKALQLAPYWEAIDIISGDIAKLPFNTFRRIPNTENGREPAINSPSFRLLRRSPNPNMTPFVFIKAMAADAVQGNAFAFIAKDRSGSPAELIKLDRHQTTAIRVDGEIQYMTITSTGKRIFMDEDEVIHIKGLSPDGLIGYDVLDKARQTAGIAYSAQAYGAKFFANDASGHVVIEVPTAMSDTAKKNLKESWEAMHQGQDNFHKTAILEQGSKLVQMSIVAKDAQLIETRKFSIKDIAGFFRMPPHKLGDDTKVSFASLEQENQSYLDTCLDPWLVAFEQEFQKKLLSKEARSTGNVFIEANRNVLLRIDTKTKWETYNTAINNGIMNRNEIRARENLNPIEGLEIFTIPLNMTDITNINDPNPDPETDPDPDADIVDEDEIAENQHNMLEAVFRKVLTRWESMRTKALASKKYKSPEQANEAFKSSLENARASLSGELLPFCKAAGMDSNDVTTRLNAEYDSQLDKDDKDDIITQTVNAVFKEIEAPHGT